MTRQRQLLRNACIQAELRHHHTKTVRSKQTHLPSSGQKRVFQTSTLRTAFLAAGREDDSPFQPRLCTLLHDLRYHGRRSHNDSEVHPFGHFLNTRERFEPEHATSVSINNVDNASE